MCLAVLGSVPAKADEQRIVTVGPWVTEAVFALGKGGDVVARDKGSTVPDAVNGLPSVGYHRQLPFEGLVSMRPTRVIASADAGPPEVLEQLRAAGIETVVVPEATTLDDVPAFVVGVAQAAGASLERARALGAEVVRAVGEARSSAAARTEHPVVLALYARGPQVLSIIGSSTATAAIIEAAGGRQAAASVRGFKTMTAEAVLAARPDVLVLTQHGLESLGGREGVRAHQVLGALDCVKAGRIVALDDALLLGLGVRAALSVSTMTKALQPRD